MPVTSKKSNIQIYELSKIYLRFFKIKPPCCTFHFASSPLQLSQPKKTCHSETKRRQTNWLLAIKLHVHPAAHNNNNQRQLSPLQPAYFTRTTRNANTPFAMQHNDAPEPASLPPSTPPLLGAQERHQNLAPPPG